MATSAKKPLTATASVIFFLPKAATTSLGSISAVRDAFQKSNTVRDLTTMASCPTKSMNSFSGMAAGNRSADKQAAPTDGFISTMFRITPC
jgi:hypothetical protein